MLNFGTLCQKGAAQRICWIVFGLCFLLFCQDVAYSQSKEGKLVKCRENGKTVYRTKCRSTKKKPPVTEPTADKEPYGSPDSKLEASDGAGSGGGSGQGTGRGSGQGTGDGKPNPTDPPSPPPANADNARTPLKLLSQPRAGYNDEARNAEVQGVVTLSVTFLANGKIGTIRVVSGLPHGLTDASVEAAKQITFQPELRNGKPVTVSRVLRYSFTLY